jgi:hypothetical protein
MKIDAILSHDITCTSEKACALKRFPTCDSDWDATVQAHTSTLRGWEKLTAVVR